MKKNTEKQGIIFKNIVTTNINFNVDIQKFSEPKDIVVEFTSSFEKSDKDKELTMKIETILYEKGKKKLFMLSFTTVGFFIINRLDASLTLEQFIQYNAPALMLPYIREFITNITTRTGLKPIILPPINIMNLIKPKK